MTDSQWKFVMDKIHDVSTHTFGPVTVHDSYLGAVLALVCCQKVRLLSDKPGEIRIISIGQ